MAIIEVIRREEGPYNPGTPGARMQAAVPNADNFISWLESKDWIRLDDSTDDCVRLENDGPNAVRSLSEYASKPQLRNGQEAWKVVDGNT